MFTPNQQSMLTASLVTALVVFMCIVLAIVGAVFYTAQTDNRQPEFTGIKVTTSSSRSNAVTVEYGTAPIEVVKLFKFCFSTGEVEQMPASLGGTLIRTSNEYILTRESDGVMMTLTSQDRCNPATQWGIQKLVIDNDDILYMYEWVEGSNR